ncbi:hypothetical protein INR49_024089 [Caranx melampygus]|nr:hypothetical protein INR49_024089 [Caranx melampygus]
MGHKPVNYEISSSFALNGAGCPGLRGGVAAAGTGLLELGGLGRRRRGSVRSPGLQARLGALFRTCVWRREVWVRASDVMAGVAQPSDAVGRVGRWGSGPARTGNQENNVRAAKHAPRSAGSPR